MHHLNRISLLFATAPAAAALMQTHLSLTYTKLTFIQIKNTHTQILSLNQTQSFKYKSQLCTQVTSL